MINPILEELVGSFLERTSAIFKVPDLLLDYSWPSVAILDSLTFLYRKKTPLSEEEQVIIRCCAIYVAQFAARCWDAAGVPSLIDLGRDGVFIETISPSSGMKPYRVDVENDLFQILLAIETPFPVLTNFSRILSNEYNRINLYALGVCFGLSAYAKGNWPRVVSVSQEARIEPIERFIAATCASWYTRLFPLEKLGQMPELYLNKLIFPPTMQKEEVPFLSAAENLISYFTELNLSHRSIQELGENLAKSADERLSGVGLAIALGLLESAASPIVVAAAESKASFVILIREAVVKFRTELVKQSDWLISEVSSEEFNSRYNLERVIGFHPWLSFSGAYARKLCASESGRSLIRAISNYQIKEITEALDTRIAEDPKDLEMRLQKFTVSIARGEYEEAEKQARSLASEPEAESSFKFYFLRGRLELGQGKLGAALKFFKKAHELVPSQSKIDYQEVSIFWAKALFLHGEYQRCLNVLADLKQIVTMPLEGLTLCMQSERKLGKVDEANATRQELLRLLPAERGVIASFMVNP